MRSQPGASARGTKPYDNDDRTKKLGSEEEERGRNGVLESSTQMD
jgi:hypothetical protein